MTTVSTYKPPYSAPAPARDAILAAHEPAHGPYSDTASVAQNLKYVAHHAPGWSTLNVVQKESVEMICTKLARILSGDPSHPDHWDDIAGYARLVSERIGK